MAVPQSQPSSRHRCYVVRAWNDRLQLAAGSFVARIDPHTHEQAHADRGLHMQAALTHGLRELTMARCASPRRNPAQLQRQGVKALTHRNPAVLRQSSPLRPNLAEQGGANRRGSASSDPKSLSDALLFPSRSRRVFPKSQRLSQ